jgi:hypothetical protein
MLVEMPDVCDEHVLEVAAAEDQQPVEALSADAADPALGMGARLRRPYRRFDEVDPFGAEDLVELAAELAVSITDQELRADANPHCNRPDQLPPPHRQAKSSAATVSADCSTNTTAPQHEPEC